MNTTTKTLPASLHAAYNWTVAAGELDEFRGLTGQDLAAYCAESAENNVIDGDGTVTASDLESLHEWLAAEISARIARYAAEHTRDCGGDRARALREMDDEPGEVATAVGCTTAEVQEWIERCPEGLTGPLGERWTDHRPNTGDDTMTTADAWNEKHPVGTRVRYWPILPAIASAPPVDTQTRSEAWALGDGTPVVLVSGKSGGVALSHLEVL